MGELFIVGAQRSGSTYLYSMLDAHPQVLMAKPVRPEPKFFLDIDEFDNGRGYYETKYFQARSSEHTYIGEKSTSYIEHKEVAGRIKSFYPNARILMILRDPVERAYSNYKFSVENGIETLPFGEALEAEQERISKGGFGSSVNPFAYAKRGHYINYIRGYSEVFDESRINIIIFEEFIGREQGIAGLYRWLGISDGFLPEVFESRINESLAPGVEDTEDIENIKTRLYGEYARSNELLEIYLNRKIDVWKLK